MAAAFKHMCTVAVQAVCIQNGPLSATEGLQGPEGSWGSYHCSTSAKHARVR